MRIVAARSSAAALDAFTARPLPPAAVLPTVLAPTFSDPAPLAAELQSALAAVSGKHREIAVVVPDSAVRVALFDFDQFPASEEEGRGVVRLRFRRNVPFDVDDAALSFVRLPSTSAQVRALAVAMPREVLDSYETVVRQAGFFPGVLTPATLAALALLDTSAPTMLVRHAPATSEAAIHSTTIVIAQGDDILLYRSVEGVGPSSLDQRDILDEVYPSLVYYEDNFKLPLGAIYLDGVALTPEQAKTFSPHPAPVALPPVTAGQSLSGAQLSSGDLAPAAGALLGSRAFINLASQPYEDRRAFTFRWAALTAATLALTVALLFLSYLHWQDSRQIDRELAGIDAQQKQAQNERAQIESTLNQPQNRGTRDRATLVNALILKKTFSWTSVFSELEHIMPPTVRVTAIRPVVDETGQINVQLTIVSETREGAIDFMRRIENTHQFRDAHILSEKHGVEDNAQNPNPNASTYTVAAAYVAAPPAAAGRPSAGGAQ